MKIYTRTGDGGETGLLGRDRVAKDDPRVSAYGSVDEVNALLGLAAAQLPPGSLRDAIEMRQRELFVLGAELARPAPGGTPAIDDTQIAGLETEIDNLEENLPPLRSFILPGGSPAGAALHAARAACRRAERETVRLNGSSPLRPESLAYLNRLSDYLFVLARAANNDAGAVEKTWPANDSEEPNDSE